MSIYFIHCIICKQKFKTVLSHQVTCNEVCRKTHLKNRITISILKRGETRKSIFCPTCNTFIEKPKAHQSYCDKKCTKKGRSFREPIINICIICHNNFHAPSRKTCSDKCRKALNSRTHLGRIPSKESIDKGLKTLYENIKNKKTKRYKVGSFYSLKMNKKFIYRSSWECRFYKCLDEDYNVVEYNAEPFGIEYVYQNKIRHYYPDILLKNNLTFKLIEIKPQRMVEKPENKAKFEAAKKYCSENSLLFEVWTEKNNPYLTEKELENWRKIL